MKYKVLFEGGLRIRSKPAVASDKLGSKNFNQVFDVVSTADHLDGERWAKLPNGEGYVCVKQGKNMLAEIVDNRPLPEVASYEDGFAKGKAEGRKEAFDEVMAWLIGRA